MTRLCRFCIGLVLAAAATTASAAAADSRTITVQGSGIVTAAPNEATFTFGVSTTAGTARQALLADNKRMTALIAAIKRQGIPSANIQTSEISLSPNMNDAGTKVVSFSASNSVSVRTTVIGKAGTIIDAAVNAGAKLVGGPSLTLSDQSAISRQALKVAVADARARAQVIAAAAHVRLGAVVTVSESGGVPVVAAAESFKTASGSTPVEGGTIQAQAQVSVTFRII